MLSPISRILTLTSAILYTLLGILLFMFTSVLAPVFAWKVTPFVAMTIACWSLGTAIFCWATLVTWRWSLVYSSLLYLWLFGFFQLLVLIAFRERLQPQHPIAWLYIAAIFVSCLAAVFGVIDWLRLRPRIEPLGQKVSLTLKILTFIVVFIVFIFGANALLVNKGTFGTNGEIFPEAVSDFTMRAFSAFFFALSLSGAPLLFSKGSAVFLQHIIGNSGLVWIIPLVALLNFSAFDLAAHPTQLIYIFGYIIVGLVEILMFYTIRHDLGYLRTG